MRLKSKHQTEWTTILVHNTNHVWADCQNSKVALTFYFLPFALFLAGFNGLRFECGELVSKRHLNRFTGKKG